MKVAIGADHAGVALKDELKARLVAAGLEVDDLGTHGPASVDYPDFAAAVGRAVASGAAERGVLVCGSGIGVAIAANKIAGVRAANLHDLYSARLAREHNDANVVTLGARLVGAELAAEIVKVFLETPFAGGRHAGRVAKISALET
jgi:ribose 5-phosphate isomerase B